MRRFDFFEISGFTKNKKKIKERIMKKRIKIVLIVLMLINAQMYAEEGQGYSPIKPLSTITGVDNVTELPRDFSLTQNYPNPFNPSTVISYQIPVNSYVSLKVFDLVGNEVAVLVNEMQNSGTYSVTFDAGKLSSGVYFYELRAGSYRAVKKLLLTK